jgi:hypothetical protein
MYLTCTVKISDESVKEFLQEVGGYSEEEVEDLTDFALQNEATEALNGVLSDYFSDYYVLDSNTVVVGEID